MLPLLRSNAAQQLTSQCVISSQQKQIKKDQTILFRIAWSLFMFYITLAKHLQSKLHYGVTSPPKATSLARKGKLS